MLIRKLPWEIFRTEKGEGKQETSWLWDKLGFSKEPRGVRRQLPYNVPLKISASKNYEEDSQRRLRCLGAMIPWKDTMVLNPLVLWKIYDVITANN